MTKSFLTRSIRSALHAVGLGVHRIGVESDAMYRLARAIAHFEIDAVFDVGANVGQFSTHLRKCGYSGQIVSFEPLAKAHSMLARRARRDARWTVHERCALGDRDGEILIHVAKNSVSSSSLPMLPLHVSAAQDSHFVDSEVAPLRRFDTVAPPYLAVCRRPFLKLDVQGAERQVLDGANLTLSSIVGIVCEISMAPLYEGQPAWLDIVSLLKAAGYTLWGLQPGFTDPRNGRVLQVDATFFRS
jgi:FkbM family methyltransferase